MMRRARREVNPRSTRSVSVRCRVVIEFRDTGAGIPHELVGRIFDPFFTTKPIGVGTGLGLSICHNFITAMDGTISVESEIGQGTTFSVSLPADSTLPSARTPSVDDPVHAHTPRARVLVVDDEVALARAIQRMLSNEHDVATVRTRSYLRNPTCPCRAQMRL